MVIYTGYNSRYAPIAEVTLPRIERWAKACGYSLGVATFQDESSFPTPWEKLDVVRATEDEVFAWIDIDIFVLDPESGFSLSPYIRRDGFTFASDSNGLCSGLFVAHGQWPRIFMEGVKWLGATNKKPPKHEQDAIKVLCQNFPTVAYHIRLMPEDVVSNPEQPWQPLAFAYHAWSGDWTDIDRGAAALAKLSNWNPETLELVKAVR